MQYLEFTIRLPKPDLRWFRFSLRTLLLFVLIACLVFGWLSDRRRLQQRLAHLEQELYNLRNPKSAWSIQQVLGPPDTAGAGDLATAWASQTPDNQKEWLVLDYSKAVIPKAVLIHETYNPGAVYKVSVFDSQGNEVVVWSGSDPTPSSQARGVSTIPVTMNIQTTQIKVFLDSPNVPGWNEIDAVGLRDASGAIQWAIKVQASSTYGQRTTGFYPYAPVRGSVPVPSSDSE